VVRIRGIKSKSGGIGKKELSINATKARTHKERGCPDIDNVQSYMRFIIFASKSNFVLIATSLIQKTEVSTSER